MDIEGWVTVLDAAQKSGLSHTTIYKAIQAGRLECVIVIGKRLVRLSDVLAYQPVGHRPRSRPLVEKRAGPGRPRKAKNHSVNT